MNGVRNNYADCSWHWSLSSLPFACITVGEDVISKWGAATALNNCIDGLETPNAHIETIKTEACIKSSGLWLPWEGAWACSDRQQQSVCLCLEKFVRFCLCAVEIHRCAAHYWPVYHLIHTGYQLGYQSVTWTGLCFLCRWSWCQCVTWLEGFIPHLGQQD